MNEKYCLKIVNADKTRAKEIILNKARFIIGKGLTADLQLNSIDIAQQHAVIFNGFSQWYIKPFSTEIIINDRTLTYYEAYRLKVGDVIKIATFSFIFAKYVPEGVSVTVTDDLEVESDAVVHCTTIVPSVSSPNFKSKIAQNSLVDKLDYFLRDFLIVLSASRLNDNGKISLNGALKNKFLEEGKEFASLVQKLEKDNRFNNRYVAVLESDNEDLHRFYNQAIEKESEALRKVENELRFTSAEFDNYRAEINVQLNKLKLDLWKKDEEILEEKENNEKLSQMLNDVKKKLEENEAKLFQKEQEILEKSFDGVLKGYLEHKAAKFEQKYNEIVQERDSVVKNLQLEVVKNSQLMIELKINEGNTASLQTKVTLLENVREVNIKRVMEKNVKLLESERSKKEQGKMFRQTNTRLVTLRKDYSSLKTEKEQLEKDLKEKLQSQENQIKQKDKEIEEHVVKTTELRGEIEDLKQIIEVLKEFNEENVLKNTIYHLEQFEKEKETMDKDSKEKIAEKQRIIDNLKTELETRNLHAADSSSLTKVKEELKEALKNYERKERELATLKTAFKSIEMNLLKSLTDKDEAFLKLENKIKEQVRKISWLERDHETLKTELNTMRYLESIMEGKMKETTEKLKKVHQIIEEELNCAICHCLLKNALVLTCGHSFCKVCFEAWKERKHECPVCRAFTIREVNVRAIDKIVEKYAKHKP